MNNIRLFDNFLNTQELNELQKLVNAKTYHFGHTSGPMQIVDNKFFSTKNIEYFFLHYMKEKVENCVMKSLVIDRAYMHIQTFGQDGGFHVDCEELNKFTFCYYFNDLSSDEIESSGGELIFKLPNKQPCISFDTRNNRGIFFPSNFVHKGIAYNRYIDKPRVCITWKLTEIL
jgi:hypothetical protein